MAPGRNIGRGKPRASVVEQQIVEILQGLEGSPFEEEPIGAPIPDVEVPGVEVPMEPESAPGLPATVPGIELDPPEVAPDPSRGPGIEPGPLPFPLPSRGPGIQPNYQGQEVQQWARQLNTMFAQKPHIALPPPLQEEGSLPMRTGVPSLQLSNIAGAMGLTEEIFTMLLQRALRQRRSLMEGFDEVIDTATSPENRWIAATGMGAIGIGAAALLSGRGTRGSGFFVNFSNRIRALTGQGGIFEGF